MYIGRQIEKMSDKFINYANSFQAVSRLGLESPSTLLDFLGNPQDDLKFIHVAGTNGKGSVCCFLQSILTEAGFKTGKFTSPDMLSVCERISIDGVSIDRDEMNAIMDKVSVAAEKTKEKLGVMPTQFEIWTAAGFFYFKEKKCDIVVLEVGLGGRLDATNVIDNTVVSVITRIDYDHMNYLGNSLKEIATEKCGIIKPNTQTITLQQDYEILSVIGEFCGKNNNKLTIIKTPESLALGYYENFDYGDIDDITLSLSGVNQVENATLAIETAKTLNISDEFIKKGLSHTKHPGRFEILSQNPTVIYDGAHNKNGFTSLLNNIERYFDTKDITFICAFMKDKDISEIFDLLAEYKDDANIITTQVLNNERTQTAEELCRQFTERGFSSSSEINVKNAFEKAKMNNNLIVICGSLYLYKDFMC